LDAALAAVEPNPTLMTDAPTTNATAAARRTERSDRLRAPPCIDDFVISIVFFLHYFFILATTAKCCLRFSVHLGFNR
jgi:hypothetical protein